MKISALILTGGSGARVQGIDSPKQFYELLGEPVFIHSLKTYDQIESITDIYLVINQNYQQKYEDILGKYSFKKLRALVPGGSDRQISVENGLAAMEKTDIVVLQDGANPTTRAEFIEECLDAARRHGACTGCVACEDTVVKASRHTIESVLERAALACTCSPQVYKFDLLCRAMKEGKKKNLTNRPTVELVHRLNHKVALVYCKFATIKIATFEDFYAAEQILRKNKCRK
ncbi:MAG: hypothetical protein A3G91_03010 [Omnitrophica WOR_2 bacterium RIFCSPLOWO2_12_FULL_50_9]|nr:MAG: hypothetical protein A3G91_03010 [Omnitrophica WOR_2 bacterium RIFCSPLOWO2_12_FULL_50_9]